MSTSMEHGYALDAAVAARIADLRRTEYARLDADRHVYVDFTGGGLYGQSQVDRHADLLRTGIFGNPHSLSPASLRASELVEQARGRVLAYFRADPDEYVVIFTANASHALKLVGESYPFTAKDRFLLTFDNHNSVNGIREFARTHGAPTTYVPLGPELRIEDEALERELAIHPEASNSLFAYPAQSNFSGVQHSLEFIARAQDAGWDVFLDAAAFAPTNRLDLSRWHPDFVSLSFYKMFGYPTGIGALLARRTALAKLHRPWFAGGTISVASVQADRFLFAEGGAAFEDGTVDYLGIPAIPFGFDVLESLGIDHVHEHVTAMTERAMTGLTALRHANGAPVLRIFGPGSVDRRGGTIAFNFYQSDGTLIDHRQVEVAAAAQRISLRTGCFCNPGAGETALRLSRGEIERCFPTDALGGGFEPFRQCIDPTKGTGAVRISFGLATNTADVDAVVAFAGHMAES